MTTTETMTTAAVADLPALAGRSLGPTAWRALSQSEVDAFADLTHDHNPIHVDPAEAAQTPFGGTIVHGFFTVAMLAPLVDELIAVEGASLSLNYGIDKLRFPAPLPVGSRFRASGELAQVTEGPRGHQLRVAVPVEVENSPKPALAAECLFRHYA